MKIKNLNKSDAINKIYMAVEGGYNVNLDDEVSYNEIESYINYIKDIVDKSKIIRSKGKKSTQVNFNKSPEFFENFKATIRKNARNRLYKLKLREVKELIEKIRNNDNHFTEREFNFLYSTNFNNFTEFVEGLDLPKINKVTKRLDEYKELKMKFDKDKMFNNEYKINSIYIPETKQKKFDKSWKRKSVVHGTSNQSLLMIMSSHFKTISQLRKEGTVINYAGSMLGDGIYFALPEQISKTMWYLDKEQDTKYIIVADIYYKDETKSKTPNSNFKYNGENMQHLLSYGMYSRDELVVLPEQINIRYILEVKPR